MSLAYFDQQPIGRTVGRRTQRPIGVPPSREARAALDTWAKRLTRVPKGIYRYSNHDDMERDRDRWQVAAMVATVRARG